MYIITEKYTGIFMGLFSTKENAELCLLLTNKEGNIEHKQPDIVEYYNCHITALENRIEEENRKFKEFYGFGY